MNYTTRVSTIVDGVLDTLTNREENVLRLRFEFSMMEKYGQQEDVGKVFNGDPWTVRQDQAKASANSATQAEANYLRDFIEGIKILQSFLTVTLKWKRQMQSY